MKKKSKNKGSKLFILIVILIISIFILISLFLFFNSKDYTTKNNTLPSLNPFASFFNSLYPKIYSNTAIYGIYGICSSPSDCPVHPNKCYSAICFENSCKYIYQSSKIGCLKIWCFDDIDCSSSNSINYYCLSSTNVADGTKHDILHERIKKGYCANKGTIWSRCIFEIKDTELDDCALNSFKITSYDCKKVYYYNVPGGISPFPTINSPGFKLIQVVNYTEFKRKCVQEEKECSIIISQEQKQDEIDCIQDSTSCINRLCKDLADDNCIVKEQCEEGQSCIIDKDNLFGKCV